MLSKSEVKLLFKDYQKKFQNIFTDKNNDYKRVYDQLSQSVEYYEVCSGSDMFLGFYCPSPVEELLVGNVHRGKILKRITKNSKITHKYGLDFNGKILTVEDYQNNTNCYYDYGENKITIICFDESEIRYIAECDFDVAGRIVRYTLGSLTYGNCKEVYQEVYEYAERGMEFVTIWEYLGVCTFDVYKLHHHEDGYLAGYESMTSDFWKDHIFEITKSKSKLI